MAERTLRRRKAVTLDSRTLKHWAEMTDANDHLEVRLAIAERFGDEQRASFFRMMIECRDDWVHRNPEWYSVAVNDVTRGLLKDIAERCGETVAASIIACLE